MILAYIEPYHKENKDTLSINGSHVQIDRQQPVNKRQRAEKNCEYIKNTFKKSQFF